jgi:hypothetical protein
VGKKPLFIPYHSKNPLHKRHFHYFEIDIIIDAELFWEPTFSTPFVLLLQNHHAFIGVCSPLQTAFTAATILLYIGLANTIPFLTSELKHITNFISCLSSSSQYFSLT